MNIYNINLFGQIDLEPIKKYLELEDVEFTSEKTEDNIRFLIIKRLCKSLGLKCEFNYFNKYFYIFSSVVGEAVCQKFNLRIHVVDDKVRLFRYNGINFVEKVKMFLETESVDEAFVDSFNFIDENKDKILKILEG